MTATQGRSLQELLANIKFELANLKEIEEAARGVARHTGGTRGCPCDRCMLWRKLDEVTSRRAG